MSINLQVPQLTDLKPRITVIGVGGAGCNAINNMIAAGLNGVDFVVANTDAQALAASSTEHRLQLGANLTEGLGAGSRPEIGQAAAEETVEEIRSQITGSHMVFIAAGMGGGTGTGAAAVIARIAKELGILTVGIVTQPFHFEGARRMRTAERGIEEIRNHVDTLIVIPNQNLFRVANEKTTFAEAFVLADQILYSGVACIVDLIIKEGLINLDFADVRTVMSGMGSAVMGTGEASGERRATMAAEEAVANPLLDEVSLKGAKGLLLSITGGQDLTLYEVDEAASRVRQEVDAEANIIVGATFDETLGDRVRVSIVASGMARSMEPAPATAGPAETPRYVPQHAPQGASDTAAPFKAAPPETYAPENGEIRRRLAEAIGAPQSNDPRGQPTSAARPPPAAAAPREAWHARADVVIEEGFSQLSWPTHSPRQHGHPGDASGAPPQSFKPAPPTDIRRGARRIPDVEDFPPLAQREYRAKTSYEPAPDERHRQHGGTDEPARRSILQRIMGRVLPADDSFADEPAYDHGQHAAHSPADDLDWQAEANDSHADSPQEAPVSLPELFSRLRK
jgi:cell division protein FtsZ